MLKRLLAPPIFPDDDEKTRSAYFINIIALTNIPVLLLFALIRAGTGSEMFGVANLILLTIAAVLVGVWLLMRAGWVRQAGYLHVSTIWVASTLIALNGSGIRGTVLTSYFVVMLMAGLLLGWRPSIFFTLFSVASAFALASAENAGLIHYVPGPAAGVAIEGTVLLIFGSIFLYLIINSLESVARFARASASGLYTSNRELTQLRDSLEIRVEDRTRELEKQQQLTDRRSRQFESIIRVSKAISAARNLHETLPQITQVISEQFGYYHVGVFLIDSLNQYAILSAANSEGGQRMLARGHQLKIGEQGIVGNVAGSGRPRIALDVGEDAAFFNNPDLPTTRSEMALPLISSLRVIGALDIQSTEANAFAAQDIEVLTALADQVSLAIENARLFDQTSKLLSESDAIQRQYLRDSWGRLPKEKRLAGYQYSIAGVRALDEKTPNAQPGSSKREVAVPINLRGETIGTLAVQVMADERISADQMDLIRAVAARVALSAENARLFDETQQRAAQLESLNEMGRVVSQQIELKSVLAAAYEQLRRIIPLDAYIVALYDEQHQSIQFPLVIDEGTEYTDRAQTDLDSGTATGKVILTGQPILQLLTEAEFASDSSRVGMLGNASKISASLMYVPLIVAQKTIGVLSIQSYSLNAYTQDQMQLVENIGNQLSIAIQNAQLFEEANRRAEREKVISEITSKISASVRTESILKTAAKELNQLLHGAEVLIKLGPDGQETEIIS